MYNILLGNTTNYNFHLEHEHPELNGSVEAEITKSSNEKSQRRIDEFSEKSRFQSRSSIERLKSSEVKPNKRCSHEMCLREGLTIEPCREPILPRLCQPFQSEVRYSLFLEMYHNFSQTLDT